MSYVPPCKRYVEQPDSPLCLDCGRGEDEHDSAAVQLVALAEVAMKDADIRAAAERLVAFGRSPAPGGTWRPATSMAPQVAEAYLLALQELADERTASEAAMAVREDQLAEARAEIERLTKDRDELRTVAAISMRGIVTESERAEAALATLERVRAEAQRILALPREVPEPGDVHAYNYGVSVGRMLTAEGTLAILDGKDAR